MTQLSRYMAANRGEWSLVLAGVSLMFLNFLLVQHAAVAFQQAEIAVIVITLAYFAGVSLGYLGSDRLPESWVRRALPVCLVIQMVLLAGMQLGYHATVETVSSWAMRHAWPAALGEVLAGTSVFLMVAGFATSVFAILLPRVIQTAGAGLQRCYSLEIAGSLIGLLLVPPLAWIGHDALLGGYFAGLVALAAAVNVAPRGVAAMGLAVTCFMVTYNDWDQRTSAAIYQQRYEWNHVEPVFTSWTAYHKVEVVRSGETYRLLLNGKRQFGGDPQRRYAYFVAEYPARILGAPRVAILGCGSMATVGRIGDFVPEIRIVDLDPVVFEAARKYFQAYNRLDSLHNWTFTADDAKHWLGNNREQFALILHDIPPARSRQVALTYTDEFFRLVKARLAPRGIFSISSLTPLDDESRYGRRMLATLTSVFPRHWVVVHRGSAYFYGGGLDLVEPAPADLLNRVDARWRASARILRRDDLATMLRHERIITTANVGDLIFD